MAKEKFLKRKDMIKEGKNPMDYAWNGTSETWLFYLDCAVCEAYALRKKLMKLAK